MPTNVVVHPRSAALADLLRSGLNNKDYTKLKLSVLTQDETYQVTERFKSRAVRFPYFDVAGHAVDYFRLRFLDDTRSFGAKKPLRYWQPGGTAPRAYFPPYVDWAELLADPKRELWVTEGEKKAAAASKAGLPTIGLGGVWSWRSAKLRQPLIPDLFAVAWKGRRVRIAFDSDPEPKPEVAGALESLGATLETYGAEVGVVTLPLLAPGSKTGLDDFLVARGKKALLEVEATKLAAGAELVRLNDELARIEAPTGVFHLPTRQLFASARPLVELTYADRRVPTVDAAGRLGDANAVSEWLRWPHHRRHAGLAFEPGEGKVLKDGKLNLWPGWPVEPKRGDVSLFTELLRYQTASLTADERRWFLQWLAYPVQHPGEKLYAAVVLWSRDTGTGKTLLAETIGRVYGETFARVTEYQLHAPWTDWLAHRQLVLGEEVTGSDRRAEANRLKYLVTSEVVDVNRKYQVPYSIRSCVNFIFTSNEPDAFLLDAKERRYFVVEVGAGNVPKPPERWFTHTYDSWYKSLDAAAALRWHLERVDLTGFNPRGRAPVTEARDDMVRMSGTELDLVMRELLASPDAYLRLGDSPITRDLFTVTELIAILDPDGRQRFTRIGVSKALRRAGAPPGHGTKTARGFARLFALRNADAWARATHSQRAAHYEGKDVLLKK